MRIEVKNGAVTATAETVQDIKMLMELVPSSTTSVKRHYTKRASICPACQKSFSNAKGLNYHQKFVHTEEGQKLARQRVTQMMEARGIVSKKEARTGIVESQETL